MKMTFVRLTLLIATLLLLASCSQNEREYRNVVSSLAPISSHEYAFYLLYDNDSKHLADEYNEILSTYQLTGRSSRALSYNLEAEEHEQEYEHTAMINAARILNVENDLPVFLIVTDGKEVIVKERNGFYEFIDAKFSKRKE